MRHFRLMAWAAAAFWLAAPVWAQVPGLMNFQGKLLDLGNNPRNGSFSLTFRAFSVPTGGTALWSETQPGVSVVNGVFAVQLGAVTPIPASVFAASPTYLEVQVGSEVGSPRQQLVTSPYAFTAQNSKAAAVAATAQDLLPGNTNYVQNKTALQAGAVFYVSSGTVGGPFVATGTVSLGSASSAVTVGGNETVTGNLTVSGAGPQVFGGAVKVNGNVLEDSSGASRITLGATNLINGSLGVPAGVGGLSISTSVIIGAAPTGDRYLAYPFTANRAIAAKSVVILGSANTVDLDTLGGCSPQVLGVAVTAATAAGQVIWVALNGVVTGVPAASSIGAGELACTSTVAGTAEGVDTGGLACGATGGRMVFGRALTGAGINGGKITVVLGGL